MSSILDALKKLEEEKAARKGTADTSAYEMETPPETVEEMLRPRRKRNDTGISTRTLLIGGVAMSVALVAVSVAVSIVVLRGSGGAPQQQAALATPPAPMPQAAPQEAAAAEPEAVPAAKTSTESKPLPEAKVAVAAKPQPKPEPKPEPAPKPEPKPAPAPEPVRVAAVAPAPKPEPVRMAEPAPAPEPEPAPLPAPEPEPVAAPEPAPIPAPVAESLEAKDVAPVADLKSLPVLRTSDRMTHGLENMRVNFLREATPSRPAAMAVINLNKIHIGEVIPGTRARLVAVERGGIGIEIADSGKRFYVPL